jgi:hypothetical protein
MQYLLKIQIHVISHKTMQYLLKIQIHVISHKTMQYLPKIQIHVISHKIMQYYRLLKCDEFDCLVKFMTENYFRSSEIVKFQNVCLSRVTTNDEMWYSCVRNMGA